MAVHITDVQRRARLVERHRLDRTGTTVDEAVGAVLALHSSDPISPYLAVWARLPDVTASQFEAAIYEDRTLWRLHAMRRTLFVVRLADAPMFDGAVGSAIAAKERARLHSWLAGERSDRSVRQHLAALEKAVMAELADGTPRRTGDLSKAIPDLQAEITVGSGKWSGRVPMSSRLLYVLAMELKIVRARPAGTWRSSQYHWVATGAWFERRVEPMDQTGARLALLERYLAAFGPATAIDIRWWAGWGAKETAESLASIAAEPVDLEGGGVGWVAAGDTGFSSRVTSSVALLPGLDSTPMGWKERSWFLADHEKPLFDRNGNIGPTIWVDGRIVGAWGQQADGRVVTAFLEPVSARTEKAVAARAVELTTWLDGAIVNPRFPAPLQSELAGRGI
ncbi:MAG: winged helix DNA-binding domain-containing protein [Acidimicrobiia bacterium]|nr:winged helix DNA-binding domain-containing protein [Acidimicrobiia bacterium]